MTKGNHLRVRTGVRAPAPIVTLIQTSTPAGAWVAPQDPLVASPRCVITPPCNHCWYCRRHKGES